MSRAQQRRGRIAVFASGTGSNLQALLNYAGQKVFATVDEDAVGGSSAGAAAAGGSTEAAFTGAGMVCCSFEVALVVSDKPACAAVELARRARTQVFARRVADYVDKPSYERAILQMLVAEQIDVIVLAGYMRLIGPELLQAYAGRITNIHPSLLPQFPGKQAIADALAAGVDETGVTVHYVDAGIDTGPIIAQWRLGLAGASTVAEVAKRIHQIEHRLYPVVVDQLVSDRLCSTDRLAEGRSEDGYGEGSLGDEWLAEGRARMVRSTMKGCDEW